MSKQDQHINDDLLVKYLLNETTAEEKNAVAQWLAAGDENKTYFNQLKKIWEESLKLSVSNEVNEEAAWQRFRSKIHEPQKQLPVRKINRFAWMRIAALFVLLAGGVFVFYRLNNEGAVENITVQSTNEIVKDTLPDGSVITLNKNSTLTYPDKFKGTERTVVLKGEAFFDITPNKQKPFIIQVNDVTVKVVGTSFNVKSENGITEVIVETGIVQVIRNGRMAELNPKEKIIVGERDTAMTVRKEEEQLYNYYRSKEFVCDNTPLWKLVDVLNEAYHSNIIIERKELRNLPLSTTFSDESLEKILEVISLTFNATIERKADKIILR